MRKSEEKEEHIMYVLIDRKDRKVWHEQFYTRADAQGKIDYEKSHNGIIGNWEIDTLYPRGS